MAVLSSNRSDNDVDANPVSSICSRSESLSMSYGYMEHNYMLMEKRQVFLRSYQFCRKKSLTERIKRSLVRVKRVMWFRLRSARKLRRLVLSRLRFALYRKRRYIRLINRHTRNSSCFCHLGSGWRAEQQGKRQRLEALLKDGGESQMGGSGIGNRLSKKSKQLPESMF